MDLAPYIGDARKLELVWLGGFTGREVEGHDWEAILSTLGWLEYDTTLAGASHIIGAMLMIAALAVAAVVVVIQLRVARAPAAREDVRPSTPARHVVAATWRPRVSARSSAPRRRPYPTRGG